MTPSRPATGTLDLARQLRAALEALAAAMGRGATADVLAQEAVLQMVSSGTLADGPPSTDERAVARGELARARAALARCRALGAAHAEITAVTLETLGRSVSYSRHGAGAPRPARGHDLHARV